MKPQNRLTFGFGIFLLALSSPLSAHFAQADPNLPAETPAIEVAPTQRTPASAPILTSPRDFAIQKMRRAGLSPDFIRLVLHVYDDTKTERIVELSVLSFLKRADYSGHFDPVALRKCTEFARKHRRQLRRAYLEYGVEPEAIAALLWVETKYGKITGKFPVASVFFSLLQADHPSWIAASRRGLPITSDPALLASYETSIRDRSATKAEWALGELKALQEMYRRQPLVVLRLKGSFAGAFGIPQFLPSSYAQWARAWRPRLAPNLFSNEDAILSVANYLHANGWKVGDTEAQTRALFHYNRAKGYGEVILKLASALPPSKALALRLPAAREE